MTGGADLYEGADQAATSAYNGARSAGLSPEAARQASYDAYWAYLKQGRGTAFLPFQKPLYDGDPHEIATGMGGKTMKIEAGTGGLTGSGNPPCNPCP